MSLQWYKTGTISVTNGSKTVVGTGTNFVAVGQLAPGDTLTVDNSTLYEIATVDSDTQLTLVDNYAGTTLAGQTYGVIRLTGTSLSNAELAGKVSALLNKWINRENEIIAWQAGTATGGTASDGRYPLTDPTGAVTQVLSPAAVAANVQSTLDIFETQLDTLSGGVGPGTNNIGAPGVAGFGGGIAPSGALPAGMTPLYGYTDPTHPNYGNYQFSDGSIMCWIPKFYYLVADANNPTYAAHGANSIDIKGVLDFANTFDANAAGYALHRAFIDGGVEKSGFFVDKYMASKNALGTGFVASSIAGGLPISTASTHNPIADLTACAGNYYYQAINAAHARDGVDGAVNADSQFFVTSRFIQAALAMLALAHGQAAINTTSCAWFDATYNFPKGCNNNALGDSNDGTVAYTSDGYSNSAKTGSGTPFAKTTHNGQACGVADLNGLMYEINLGMTCIASGKAITAISNATPCNVTAVGHGLTTGDYAQLSAIVGMTELNNKIFTVTVIDVDNFTLDGVDSSAFGVYTSAGTATVGKFYCSADSTEMRKYTAGNTLATDHWGATGVAAMMTPIQPALETGYPSNGFAQRLGDGAGQVLAADLAGDPWLLAGLGMPATDAGLSTAGTNLFGTDYHYQYIRNDMCLLSSFYWSIGSVAGVWALVLCDYRTYSFYGVGFRAACYPAV